MIRNTQEKAVIENAHGGVGSIEIHKKITKEDKVEGLSLFAKVVVSPHSTIGYHQHTDDAEAYYVLKGEGIFLDHNEERVPVKAGDICLIKKGQSHGLENLTDHVLEMIAVVY
jgi:mannose-6-phosphate isomerase-like protein (cupin superfamily)